MKGKPLCLLLSLLLICLLALAGCGQQKTEGRQKSEQVLKVAISTDINSWDISKFPDGDARFVWSQIFETLVRLDPDLKLVPGLAESWESQDNGQVWIFHLRKGVKFHDGTPFTSEAVKYSYGRNSNVTQAKTLPVKAIEAVDDHTVKFICAKPTPLPTYLTHIAWPIMSPSSVDANGKFIKPIGTGPFTLSKYTKGQEVVMERNNDYWGEKPKLEKVIFKIIPDASTRMLALRSGDVDMSIKVPEADVPKLEQDEQITVHRKLSTFTDFLQFNCMQPPFDDVNVRRAVGYAIDSKGIVKNILNGVGVAAQGRPYSPAMMYSSEDLPLYDQDIERAKALLLAAGWKDQDGDGVCEKNGQALQVDILLSPAWGPRQQKIAEACQAQMGEAGFAVNIKQLESAAVERLAKEGDFDILMRTGYFVWGPYPHHVKIHHSKNYQTHYNNPAYDQLVEQGESESDEAAKQKIYNEVQKMILDQMPAYYIVHEQKIVATRKNVQGYHITAEDPWLELRGVYLAD